MKLADEFGRLHGFGRWVLGVLAKHAGLEVAGQRFNAERIESRADCGNLVQDIDAIPVLIDRALDTGDTVYPSPNFFRVIGCMPDTYTLYKYYASGRDAPLLPLLPSVQISFGYFRAG